MKVTNHRRVNDVRYSRAPLLFAAPSLPHLSRSLGCARDLGYSLQSMPLSYSQLRRYRTCPRQYEFSNIKKVPWGISEGESFGSSAHNALKKWGESELGIRDSGLGHRKKMRGVREDQMGLFAGEVRPDIPSELTEDRLIALWHEAFIVDTYATRLEADFARKRGENLMRQYYLWWSVVPRKVFAVEKSFSMDVAGLPFSGRLDRIEETPDGIIIMDYKTGAPCTQDEADADLQLSLYAMAAKKLYEKPCAGLQLLFLSEEGVIERITARSAGQLKDAEIQIRLIRERLEAKDFRPTPSIHACKRCPYRGICDVAVK